MHTPRAGIIIHKSVKAAFVERLVHAYQQVTIGIRWRARTLMGPLVDQGAVDEMLAALTNRRADRWSHSLLWQARLSKRA
jgi:acyl-CoA reductase-like NAD-dependent aldehyde dehydrogenase